MIYRPGRPVSVGGRRHVWEEPPSFLVVVRGETQDVGFRYQTGVLFSNLWVAGFQPESHFQRQALGRRANTGPIWNRAPFIQQRLFSDLGELKRTWRGCRPQLQSERREPWFWGWSGDTWAQVTLTECDR